MFIPWSNSLFTILLLCVMIPDDNLDFVNFLLRYILIVNVQRLSPLNPDTSLWLNYNPVIVFYLLPTALQR